MTELGHAGEPAEGEFFPDTYRFAANTADTAI
jgi:cell division protein YceG involved in septum cleavage